MIQRHRSLRPRAHWVLFALSLISLLLALIAAGVAQVRPSGTSASGLFTINSSKEALAGPVVDMVDGKLVVRRMPPKTVALTFEDGPDPNWTPLILDLLKAYGAKATFFVVGSRVNQYPELVRRMVAEGHEIGLHSYNHANFVTMSAWQRRAQLNLTRDAVAAAAGIDVTLLRLPYSSTPATLDRNSLAVVKEVGSWGYRIVLSDLDSMDAQQPGTNLIAASAAPVGESGAIVLMHDGGGSRRQTVWALQEKVLSTLVKRDYLAITVSQAIPGGPPPAQARPDQIVRGRSVAFVQAVATTVAKVLFVLLIVAAGLTTIRVVVQFCCAWLHKRRRRRATTKGLTPPVSVIVPAYNEAANIAATVTSLVATGYPGLEIIVVDDGSSDNTADIVSRLDLPGVRLIKQANAGKSAALTNGIENATHDLLVLIDGDTIVERETLHLLVEPFEDPAVGGVAGNAKVANRTGLLGRLQHVEYVVAFNLERRVFEIGDCMPTVPGALGAFRRKALTDAGGMSDETLAEDTDLTMAVCRAGWRIVYKDSACAWTEAPGTWRGLWRQRSRWCFGTLQAMWKHRAAFAERGASGKLGRRGLTYLLIFQILQPLLAPVADVYLIFNLVFEPFSWIVLLWLALTGMQLAIAVYAFKLDRERAGPLWTLILQQILYRQLIYLVVIQSVTTALVGSKVGWHQPARSGHAAALADGSALVAQVLKQQERRNRTPAPLWARLCVWAGVFLTVLSAGTIAGAQALISKLEGAINQADLLGVAATFHNGQSGMESGAPLNLLIVGIDWRKDETGPIRADTIMIMHVPRTRDRAYLMSLPRDTLVDAPPAPKMNFPGGRTKLNTAFALGAGIELDRVQGTRFLAERALELTGLAGFDGALLVDFYGFMEIVKAFDGIDVCVDADTESQHSGVVYHKGCSRMDAASALDYVRQRKSLAGGDFARQRHQQQFIKAIVKEATTSNVLTDPVRLDQLVRAAGSSMTVCTGPLNPTEFLLAFRGIRADTISMIRTPAEHETDDQSRYLGEKLTPEAIEIFTALREERLDTFVTQHPDIVSE